MNCWIKNDIKPICLVSSLILGNDKVGLFNWTSRVNAFVICTQNGRLKTSFGGVNVPVELECFNEGIVPLEIDLASDHTLRAQMMLRGDANQLRIAIGREDALGFEVNCLRVRMRPSQCFMLILKQSSRQIGL